MKPRNGDSPGGLAPFFLSAGGPCPPSESLTQGAGHQSPKRGQSPGRGRP